MPIMKVALLVLVLTYLSGTFTLNRLNLGITMEVRYILFVVFLLVCLLGATKGTGKGTRIRDNLVVFLLTLIFYVFLSAISLFYTLAPNMAVGKFVSLLFLLMLLFGTVFIVRRMSPRDFFSVLSTFFIVIGVCYAIPVIFSVLSGASRGDVNLSGPNVTTRILFFATCASLYKYSFQKKIWYLIAILFFLASIVLVGSRGGLVGAAGVFLIMFLIKKLFVGKIKTNNKLTFKKLLLIPLCIAIVYFIYEPVKKVFMERIIGVTFDGNKVYTSGRDIIYEDAIEMIKEKPFFGFGIDSFTVHTGHVYPHNLLLEMMVEIGLLGAFVFFIFLLYSIILIFRFRKSPLFVFSGLPLYMILVQMFSGEFYDFRYYFLWSIPLLMYGAVSKMETTHSLNK